MESAEDAGQNQEFYSGDESNATESPSETNKPEKADHGEPETYDPGWPPLSEAAIRPGIYLKVGAEENCTTNFIFKSPGNQTLFIGTAAHCVAESSVGISPSCHERDSYPIGSSIPIEGAEEPGILVYSSWATMVELKEADSGACSNNDFALIEIHELDRPSVHPAMLYFGGPTDLAVSSSLQISDRLFSYGRSVYHGGVENLERREGYMADPEPLRNEWNTYAYMATPGIPGDSGSPVIDEAGRAVGVLVAINIFPKTGTNRILNLDLALDYLHENTKIELELANWGKLNEGVLPDT